MAPSVLIVDDALFMRMMIKDILSKDGFVVVGEAENGAEAVEKYENLRPDLVTMDIVMPEMDGIEAVRSIIKIDPGARVLMCSAMGQQPLVVEALEAGARDFIIKPFQPAKVVEAVRKALHGEE
jgi:two-component system chemotaxis response regulator CheY